MKKTFFIVIAILLLVTVLSKCGTDKNYTHIKGKFYATKYDGHFFIHSVSNCDIGSMSTHSYEGLVKDPAYYYYNNNNIFCSECMTKEDISEFEEMAIESKYSTKENSEKKEENKSNVNSTLIGTWTLDLGAVGTDVMTISYDTSTGNLICKDIIGETKIEKKVKANKTKSGWHIESGKSGDDTYDLQKNGNITMHTPGYPDVSARCESTFHPDYLNR